MSDDKETLESTGEQRVESEDDLATSSENEQQDVEAVDDTVSVEELQQQLEEATEKTNTITDKLLRSQAEMENLRRRTEKELQNAHKFALDQFSKDLLAVVDSLELGIQAFVGDAPDVTKLREGNKLTLQLMKSVLEKFNIVAVDPIGDVFNPELHQAMAMEPAEDAEPNTVLKVFQKGYTLNDRLIRPAMVVVAQASEHTKIDEQA